MLIHKLIYSYYELLLLYVCIVKYDDVVFSLMKGKKKTLEQKYSTKNSVDHYLEKFVGFIILINVIFTNFQSG